MTTEEKIEEVSADLTQFVNERVIPGMPDTEFVSVCSALMIALNRQLARCAASFGEVNGVDQDTMTTLVRGQFDNHYAQALAALRQPQGMVQ